MDQNNPSHNPTHELTLTPICFKFPSILTFYVFHLPHFVSPSVLAAYGQSNTLVVNQNS